MRRGPALVLLLLTGCSTAPVADLLDFFLPGKLPPDKTTPYGGVCLPQGVIAPTPAPLIPVTPVGVPPPVTLPQVAPVQWPPATPAPVAPFLPGNPPGLPPPPSPP